MVVRRYVQSSPREVLHPLRAVDAAAAEKQADLRSAVARAASAAGLSVEELKDLEVAQVEA